MITSLRTWSKVFRIAVLDLKISSKIATEAEDR
jgi:hypothetical protein